jgi:hypothetical protein
MVLQRPRSSCIMFSNTSGAPSPLPSSSSSSSSSSCAPLMLKFSFLECFSKNGTTGSYSYRSSSSDSSFNGGGYDDVNDHNDTEGDADYAEYKLVVLLKTSDSKADSEPDTWTLYDNGKMTIDLSHTNPSKLKSATFHDLRRENSTDVTERFKQMLQTELDQSTSQNKVQLAKERHFQSFLRHHGPGTFLLLV